MTTPDDDDLFAAEYVLGTLDADERTAAAERLTHDGGFAAQVAAWERRLVPLSDAARDAAPSAAVWAGILRRLGFAAASAAADPALAGTVVLLTRSAQRWRRATLAVSALAACLAVVVVMGAWRAVQAPAPTFIALLQKTDVAPAYLVKADLRDKTLAVRALAAKAPPGRDFELWIIDPQIGPPKSLGVLDPTTSTHPLPAGTAPDILARATYAVTEEQAGGSPTGAPSGPPIYVGHLVASGF